MTGLLEGAWVGVVAGDWNPTVFGGAILAIVLGIHVVCVVIHGWAEIAGSYNNREGTMYSVDIL